IDRYLGSIQGDFEFSPAVTLFGEFTFSRANVSSIIEPLAVDDGGAQGQTVYNFDGAAFSGIPLTNPLVPQTIRDAAVANGASQIFFRRRSNGLFDRSADSERNYWRGVVGLRGDL